MSKQAKETNKPKELDFESKQNLIGFFRLLIEVDQRINPDLYKKQIYDRHSRTKNTQISN